MNNGSSCMISSVSAAEALEEPDEGLDEGLDEFPPVTASIAICFIG